MGIPRGRGTPVPPSVESEAMRVLGGIGDANLQPRGSSLGTPEHDAPAGFLDAVWSVVQLTGTEVEIRVAHSLGRVPSWAHQWEAENQDGNTGHVTLNSAKRTQWSATEIIMRVAASGTYAGYRILVLVG